MSKEIRPKVHFENLDAFRFLAFFAVFVLHFFQRMMNSFPSLNFLIEYVPFGEFGVNFFFVLSGFLITWLLLKEEEITGSYNTVNFWMRRILRIWPLYFACVIYGFWIYGIIYRFENHTEFPEVAKPAYFLLFLSNFSTLNFGFANNTTLNVLWSVAVEEQFYFFWPIFFMFKSFRPILFVVIIFSSVYFRFANIQLMSNFSVPPMRYHTFNVMGDLATGGLFAWIAHCLNFKHNQVYLNKVLNICIYSTGIVFFFIRFHDPVSLTLRPLIISMIFGYVIFEQVFVSRRFYNLGKVRLFDTWGRYTYGLYCLHPIGILLGYHFSRLFHFDSKMVWAFTGELSLSFGLSILLAYLSYRYLELPFLKLKKRFSFLLTTGSQDT
jgi:peptidoglycan/LPS O-acetylase OafA/YrhL